jgi:Mlc titration factor MtfA (ptsG expression regulator)
MLKGVSSMELRNDIQDHIDYLNGKCDKFENASNVLDYVMVALDAYGYSDDADKLADIFSHIEEKYQEDSQKITQLNKIRRN